MALDAKIELRKIWCDDDLVELAIVVSDGVSSFSNKVYVADQDLVAAAAGLGRFKEQAAGGIFDLRFGEFGPEYAAGAFHARVYFNDRGGILVTVRTQSNFAQFGGQYVAGEATLYLVALPAALDDFVRGLQALSDGHRDDAELVASALA